jgi:hypothetical protein
MTAAYMSRTPQQLARTADRWVALLSQLPDRLRATAARLVWWDFVESCPGLDAALAQYLDVAFDPEIADSDLRWALARLGYNRAQVSARLSPKTRAYNSDHGRAKLGSSRRKTDVIREYKPAIGWAIWGNMTP